MNLTNEQYIEVAEKRRLYNSVAQCIRNDKLQDENAKLKAQINEVKR